MCSVKYSCRLSGSLFSVRIWGGNCPLIIASRTDTMSGRHFCTTISRTPDRAGAAKILESWRKVTKVTKELMNC